jgi:hypothetical protein
MATKRLKFEHNEMVTFRVIPHISVTNNTNAKLWRVLHKMYEIYDRLPNRITREGFTFTVREKDTIWFDMVFHKGKIEFYVSTSQLWAKKLREVIENRLKVTIEEAELSALEVPTSANVYDVRFARHDIFSLNIDHREQTSPIAGIMSALEDVQDEGDFARLSVCAETMDRAKWLKIAGYAHEKLAKGKIPQRAKITSAGALKALKTMLAAVINEMNDLVTDFLNAISNAFFKSEKAAAKSKLIEKPVSLEDEILATRISNHSANKLNQPVWKTRIRVAAHSETKLRADLIANTIGGAFGEIAGDNEFQAVKIRFSSRREEIIRELNTLHLTGRTKADGDANLLSCDELAKIALQLPTASVQQRYEQELAVNRKVETEVPSALTDPKGIPVGHAELKGVEYPIYLPVSNLDETFRSYAFVGAPRMGKDTIMKNIVAEACLRHGFSTFVIDAIMEDGERGFADGIRDTLPPDRIVDLDLSNAEFPIPMDLTEVVRKLGRNGTNRFAQEIIDFFGDIEDKPRSRAILREAAKASGGSLFAIKRILEDDEFRAQRVAELRAEGADRLADTLESWKLSDSKIDPILSRLDSLFGDDLLFNIFAQPPKPEVDFEKWIREGKVVIVRVPNRKLGALATKTLIHWVTLKIFMTKLLMAPSDGQAFIVFNEPHQYLTPGLKHLMQRIILEGPKWRVAGLFAFHHFDLLKFGLDDDLISGGLNWFLFANDNRKVFERLEAQLKPTFDVDLALTIEAYHAIVISRFGGRRQNAFLMRALEPPSERLPQFDNSFLSLRHSRMFGRDWREVERILA